jgi:putative SOS response-associated peptidase YedK
MAFAGLSERFDCQDSTVMQTFTIVTTNANAIMAELHNRMPVIVEPENWPTWLGEFEGDPAALLRSAGEGVEGPARQQAGESARGTMAQSC